MRIVWNHAARGRPPRAARSRMCPCARRTHQGTLRHAGAIATETRCTCVLSYFAWVEVSRRFSTAHSKAGWKHCEKTAPAALLGRHGSRGGEADAAARVEHLVTVQSTIMRRNIAAKGCSAAARRRRRQRLRPGISRLEATTSGSWPCWCVSKRVLPCASNRIGASCGRSCSKRAFKEAVGRRIELRSRSGSRSVAAELRRREQMDLPRYRPG